MDPSRIETKAVTEFSCLGAECPDTCCHGWSMQLTRETQALYASAAPELLDAIEEAGGQFQMKQKPDGSCVKLEQGLCNIHRDYGDTFLGDACHFFPRITRALGSFLYTTAALSCPESARLMLGSTDGFNLGAREEVRVPYSLRNYLPAGMEEEAALAIHQQFMALAGEDPFTAGYNFLRVSAVANAIAMQPVASWGDAISLYASMAESRIPNAEPAAADMVNLLHALHGLLRASTSPRPGLVELVGQLAERLGVAFDGQGGITLAADASLRGLQLLAHMRAQATTLQPLLRRYLQAQMSQALFPFAGFGDTLPERTAIIGVRLATVRLALATLPEQPSLGEVIGVIQPLSRFMDHLADPTYSLQIYRETGWVREARLRALLGE